MHIQQQARLLEEEEQRVGVRIDRPTSWIIDRELREYELADQIVVLSTSSRESFISEGVDAHRLRLLPIGARLTEFGASREVISARSTRVRSGKPLRILFVGALSVRKGISDLTSIASQLVPQGFEFRFVGPIADESRGFVRQVHDVVEIVGAVPERDLPKHYDWGDIFIFPTIEDGAPIVLMQARAAGLPILVTPNCSGPDIVEEARTGWILAARDQAGFVERLLWCDREREKLAMMIEVGGNYPVRSWDEVASDFVLIHG